MSADLLCRMIERVQLDRDDLVLRSGPRGWRRGAYSEIKVWRRLHLLGHLAHGIAPLVARCYTSFRLYPSPRDVSVDAFLECDTTGHLALLDFVDGPVHLTAGNLQGLRSLIMPSKNSRGDERDQASEWGRAERSCVKMSGVGPLEGYHGHDGSLTCTSSRQA